MSSPGPSISGKSITSHHVGLVLTLNAFAYRSGEGRGDESGANLYENFAEATVGKGVVDMTHVLPTGTTDYEEAAEAEERGEKEKAKGVTERSESGEE